MILQRFKLKKKMYKCFAIFVSWGSEAQLFISILNKISLCKDLSKTKFSHKNTRVRF